MIHSRYKRFTSYCCCTTTVQCNYCIGQGKPVHLIVDKEDMDTVNELNELQNKMNYSSKLNDHGSFIHAIRTKQFIVGSVDANGFMSFAHNPTAQTTRGAARVECNRLAKLNTGKMYIFVELGGAEYVPVSVQTVSI